MKRIFQRHFALPTDHGAWVFLISPLLIGLFAGKEWKPATIFLLIGAFSAFLLRQPLTIAVKSLSGRRSRRDLTPALFWIILYCAVGLISVVGLVIMGTSYLLLLAIPGVPVFAWHLYLVSRRAERRQIGVELVGSGVLALAAPAGFWVGKGNPDGIGWWLFGLAWLQSAASIVYAYVRLEQRELRSLPTVIERFKIARRAILYAGANLIVVGIASSFGFLSPLIILPFALQFGETLWGAYHPAIGVKPTLIGLRQLIVSSLFTILFILTWR